MGSLLGSSLALQYLDCVQDESAFLRLNFWLGHALQEGKNIPNTFVPFSIGSAVVIVPVSGFP